VTKTPRKPKTKSWKDHDPTAVINIMRRALGGPEKYATEYAAEVWKDAWAPPQQHDAHVDAWFKRSTP
jgi:hypothetical protein